MVKKKQWLHPKKETDKRKPAVSKPCSSMSASTDEA